MGAAIRAVTINAAWQCFSEQEVGSLEVGKLADLVILERETLVQLRRMRLPKLKYSRLGSTETPCIGALNGLSLRVQNKQRRL